MTTLIVSKEEMNDNMKIVKSLEEFVLLIKSVSNTIKNEPKIGGFLSMLLGTLGVCLLGNLLTGKGTIGASGSTIRAGQDFKCCLIFYQILKCKSLMKMNLNLKVFFNK